jgi:predicted RNA-binding Zn-ribbon protein involved in translation (DUF1610 family)
LDSISELEWTSALQGLLSASETETDEAYRKKTYSKRACPHCARFTLVRWALPRHLRLVRKLGVDLRHYACDNCSQHSVVRHKEPHF